MAFIPRTLEDALRDRFVVPFVGAGVSMAVTHRSGGAVFPSWVKLLRGAATRLRDDGKRAEADVVTGLLEKRNPDYLQAARYAREGLGAAWFRYLREELDPATDQIDPASLALARAVWQLPSRLVVTTNYDQVLRLALAGGAGDLVQLNVDATAELPAILRDRIERPTVWHLHGHIHDAQRLILTPDGYNELYPSEDVEVRYRAALYTLRHLLAARTFLFIGFSLDDERFGSQIAWVNQAFAGATGPHYMLVRERDLHEAQRRLSKLDGIEMLTFEEFGAPLVARVEELARVGRPTPSAAPPDASPMELATPAAARAIAKGIVIPEPAAGAHLANMPMAEVRKSYRLVYEYQRRLFDCLAAVSDALGALGLEFERWDPALFSRHAKSSSQFFRRRYWAWDFLPAYNLILTWQSSGDNGSKSVVLEAVADTGWRKSSGAEPHPQGFDAVDSCSTELRVNLLRSTAPDVYWAQAWPFIEREGEGVFDGQDHEVDVASKRCTYRYFHVDPAKFMASDEGLREHVVEPIRRWLRGAPYEG